MSDLHAQDPNSWLETVWDALENYRDVIPEGDKMNDDEWSDICTAMHWIDEALKEDADDGYVTVAITLDRSTVPALDADGKFIYNEGSTV